MQDFGDRLPGHRVHPIRRDLLERLEHEQALAEAWMRHRQAGRIDDGIAAENQIQIDGARRVWIGALAAEPLFDRQQHVEDRGGRQVRLPNHRRIEKHRLRHRDADRFGFVE